MMASTEKQLLIVDDDESDVHLLITAMRLVGIQNPATVIHTGTDAIKYLEGSPPYADRLEHPLPVLVFLDLKLQDMSGMEVLRWIADHRHLRRITVIVHSGIIGHRDVELLYLAGANSFLRKSSDLKELRNIAEYYAGCFDFAPDRA